MELSKATLEYLMSLKAQMIDNGIPPDPNGTHDLITNAVIVYEAPKTDIIPHPDFNPSPNW
jgi:hypothetical protein